MDNPSKLALPELPTLRLFLVRRASVPEVLVEAHGMDISHSGALYFAVLVLEGCDIVSYTRRAFADWTYVEEVLTPKSFLPRVH